jgi:hypothetical protein
VCTCRSWRTGYTVAWRDSGCNLAHRGDLYWGSTGDTGTVALWPRERLGWTWLVATKQLVEILVHFLKELVARLLVLPVLLPLFLGWWRSGVMMGLVVRGDFLLLFLDGAFTDMVGLERNYHGGSGEKGNLMIQKTGDSVDEMLYGKISSPTVDL